MRFLSAVLAALLFSFAAQAQVGPTVSQGPSDLQGSTGVCATAPAINAQSTCTITVPANQHAYINFLQVGACADYAAAATSAPQLAFTSTNLNGWTQQVDAPFNGGTALSTTSIFQGCSYVGGMRIHPLVSAAGPVSVTVVSPAAQAHTSYPINIEYYLAQ
jgi:hypothetical protein